MRQSFTNLQCIWCLGETMIQLDIPYLVQKMCWYDLKSFICVFYSPFLNVLFFSRQEKVGRTAEPINCSEMKCHLMKWKQSNPKGFHACRLYWLQKQDRKTLVFISTTKQKLVNRSTAVSHLLLFNKECDARDHGKISLVKRQDRWFWNERERIIILSTRLHLGPCSCLVHCTKGI